MPTVIGSSKPVQKPEKKQEAPKKDYGRKKKEFFTEDTKEETTEE